MRTTFSGISTALRALQAQQRSLDVTGHNVANVNNPAYSRQSAIHSATKPYPTPMMGYTPSNGQLGTGVEISQIVRMRDQFVENRLRQQNHSLSYWESLRDGLQQVELFFNEPSESGIHSALDQLWDSLQDLSRDADLASVREVVVQRAEVLVESIRNTRQQLQKLRGNLNSNVAVRVGEINSLAAQIADLNNQIGKVTATGSHPNDLLDTRDALLEELSKIVDIEVVQDHANMVGVTIGGASLVHRSTSYALDTRKEAEPREGYDKSVVYWAATGTPVDIGLGELAGMIQLRDYEVQGFIDSLDSWTKEFVGEFNRIHAEGYDLYGNKGDDFFKFSNDDDAFAALNVMVNEDIAEDPNKIAAAAKDEDEDDIEIGVGNGKNALALARLRNTPPKDAEITIGESFNAIISRLGVTTQKAIKMVETDEVLAGHLTNLRESVSGVSLDEEMANMIRFQHAYNAAARMMTAVDESLDVIINRLGVVGR